MVLAQARWVELLYIYRTKQEIKLFIKKMTFVLCCVISTNATVCVNYGKYNIVLPRKLLIGWKNIQQCSL